MARGGGARRPPRGLFLACCTSKHNQYSIVFFFLRLAAPTAVEQSFDDDPFGAASVDNISAIDEAIAEKASTTRLVRQKHKN
jgi:hypothetical protein